MPPFTRTKPFLFFFDLPQLKKFCEKAKGFEEESYRKPEFGFRYDSALIRNLYCIQMEDEK